MRYEVRITKLVKKVEYIDPKDGLTKIKDEIKMAFDKDVEKYLGLGYKDVEILKVKKDFTPQQKAYYIDGDLSQKRQIVVISPEDKARKSFENEITNMTIDELQELADRYKLNLILGTFETVAQKRKAVLDAVIKQENDYNKKTPKKEDVVQDEALEDVVETVTQPKAKTSKAKPKKGNK